MSTPEFQEPFVRPGIDGGIYLVISQVWQEKDPERVNGVLTKYRVETRAGELVGVFLTPSGSRLSEAMLAYAKKRKLGK